MAAGLRSLHAFWVGGAGAGGATPACGPHSLLAPWVGGAGVPAEAPETGGYRSLLAWWTGGAGSTGEVEPPAPAPAPVAGVPRRVRLPQALVDELALRRIDEDDVLLLLAWQISAGLVH